MVAAQLILINHFLMTLTKNSVDIPAISSKNSVVAESGCPYGCTHCSPINGCLACKPPYYLLLLREGTMQTAHCTKACPKGFYRINRKKNGFCSKCTQRGCLECLNDHYCTLCEDGFKHHQGRCHSHNDTDDMGGVIFLERKERILNNITMSTTPTTNLSVSFISETLSSTISVEQSVYSETTSTSYLPETSTISAELNTINPVVETATSVNGGFTESSSTITSTEKTSSFSPNRSSNSTNKLCRKRVRIKGKERIKGKLKNDVTHIGRNKNNKQNNTKERKCKSRNTKKRRKCSGRQRQRKRKKKKEHSGKINDEFTNVKNHSINVSSNNTSWLTNITDRTHISKSSTLNNIPLPKYRNKWKQHRIRHYPRHKRLKRLLQQRHIFEEAQKALQQQRYEKDDPQKSASAASIANKIRELRQKTLHERALRKKKKWLCLYRQRQRRWKTKRPHDDIYYGPGSVFDGLM